MHERRAVGSEENKQYLVIVVKRKHKHWRKSKMTIKAIQFLKVAIMLSVAVFMTVMVCGHVFAFDPVKLNTSTRSIGAPNNTKVIFDAETVPASGDSAWSTPVDVSDWGDKIAFIFAYANGTVSGEGIVTATYQCGVLDSSDDNINWYYPFYCATAATCTVTKTGIGGWVPGDSAAGFAAGEGWADKGNADTCVASVEDDGIGPYCPTLTRMYMMPSSWYMGRVVNYNTPTSFDPPCKYMRFKLVNTDTQAAVLDFVGVIGGNKH